MPFPCHLHNAGHLVLVQKASDDPANEIAMKHSLHRAAQRHAALGEAARRGRQQPRLLCRVVGVVAEANKTIAGTPMGFRRCVPPAFFADRAP